MSSYTTMTWLGKSLLAGDEMGLARFTWTDANGHHQQAIIRMECSADAMRICEYADAMARNRVENTRKELLRIAENLK